MTRLIVFNPELMKVDYAVFLAGNDARSPVKRGSIRSGGGQSTGEDIMRLVYRHAPEAVAVRVLYGGEQFDGERIYDRSVLKLLEGMVPQSPLHIPPVIRLLRTLERIVPTPEIILFFETAFFVDLPFRERRYAIDNETPAIAGVRPGALRRYGYNGLLHEAASRKISQLAPAARRVLSVCLEPVPEVVGIYDGKPVAVSSGSTPLEGLPGNTTCGEIDPGIVLYIEEKKRYGPETIDDLLTRKSGLSALAGERVTVGDVLSGGAEMAGAREFFRYRVLLAGGSAAAAMNGVDAIVFSGRYSPSGLSDWLSNRLAQSFPSANPPIVVNFEDAVETVIAVSVAEKMRMRSRR